MNDSPSTTASNGRDSGGKFASGNKLALGNPLAKRVARLRFLLIKAVRPADLREVVATLLASAKAGDVAAAREVLQRVLGPPQPADLLERLEALEARIDQNGSNRGRA